MRVLLFPDTRRCSLTLCIETSSSSISDNTCVPQQGKGLHYLSSRIVESSFIYLIQIKNMSPYSMAFFLYAPYALLLVPVVSCLVKKKNTGSPPIINGKYLFMFWPEILISSPRPNIFVGARLPCFPKTILTKNWKFTISNIIWPFYYQIAINQSKLL